MAEGEFKVRVEWLIFERERELGLLWRVLCRNPFRSRENGESPEGMKSVSGETRGK